MSEKTSVWDGLEAIVSANGGALDENIADILAAYGTPSTSIAILDNGSISAKCFSTVGDDTETVFQACSISKPVAAMAAMKLVAAGYLSLDAPITDYLAPHTLATLATRETADLLKHVKVRHLLSHTAGLTVHGFPGYISTPPIPETILSGKAPANTLQVRLAGLPGHRFAYSGGGITVLQIILEQITGKPFAEMMSELVLAPLGMRRSFYRTPTSPDNHASAFWTGYQAAEVPFRVQPEQAAAGLWTTPTDLLKVVRALQDSLDPASPSPFLPRDVARSMLTEIDSGMALGWFASASSTGFQHSGGNFGFRCHVFGYADLDFSDVSNNKTKIPEKTGICVMTNSEEGYDVVRKIEHAIAFTRGWPGLGSTYGSEEIEIPFRTDAATRFDKEKWLGWVGKWGSDWELIDVDGQPSMCFQNLPAVALRPAARPPALGKNDTACVDLVMDGLEMMVRLKKQDGEKILDIWHGAKRDSTTLRRP